MQVNQSFKLFIAALATSASLASTSARAQSDTSFTYQGSLQDSGAPVDGSIPMDFKLFDAETAGNQVGSTISSTITPVDGVFSESLDFGAAAHEANQALWLEITVDGTALSRQRLEAAPYALNTRGIKVEDIQDVNFVTIPDGILIVDPKPNGVSIPSGSSVRVGATFGNPGIQITKGNQQLYGCLIDSSNRLSLNAFDLSTQTIRMVLTPDGLFGLGTTTPQSKLDINGELRVGDGSTAEQDISFFSANGAWQLGTNNTGIGTDNNQFFLWDNSTGEYALTVQKGTGRVGIGTTTPTTSLDINGAITIRGGADIVEGFQTATTDLIEPGTLMVIDPANPGKLMISTDPYDAKVAGIVSGANGVNPGIKLGQDGVMDGDLPIAMTGRVYVKCSTENGNIMPGDRLTTSSIPGHAMKATDSDRSDGAVIGKAMTSIDTETGMVLVLVNLQ